ncbi:hypothetical protein [Acinetobacter beijerinckii]|uniref:hypothetical protein n=1 Tax=Acinetobacter beijerinckii TaxID=262668 RepID=UPI003009C0FA
MVAKLSTKVILTAFTFATAFTFVGCDQTSQENEQNQQKTEIEKTITDSENTQTISAKVQKLSDGNMLNIAYDIAKLQIETDDYITTLKQSQLNLQQAIQDKNIQSLESTTNNLKQELNGLRDVLLSLNLKSGEVDQIRQSLLTANQQLLNMPLLQGQVDLSKIDFAQVEKQLNTIQMDIVKLATLLLGNNSDSNT